MQKIALVFSFKQSNWVSCQKIVVNLHRAYGLCPNTQLGEFNYSLELEAEDIRLTAKKIVQFTPDIISIIDHKPHPLSLFHQLAQFYDGKVKPKIVFHIFGDFSIYYGYWEQMETVLKGFHVEFLVASERQKTLIDRMFLSNTSQVCPFPADENEFAVSENLRFQCRAEWKLMPDDVAFVFTGRLSRQKRIKTLITCFAEEFASDPKAHLFIYGNHDKIADPFLGTFEIEGEYFRKFFSAYRSFSPEIQERIHFMGGVHNSELPSVYQGADVLVNLSVHNDEDFGMSVAEAQLSGLPAILTDWGGLAGFEHPELLEATAFIPVQIGKYSKKFSSAEVKKAMRAFFEDPKSTLRARIQKLAQHRFGLKKGSENIEATLKGSFTPFKGYSPLFKKALKASSISSQRPMYISDTRKINSLYTEIYSAYVRHD